MVLPQCFFGGKDSSTVSISLYGDSFTNSTSNEELDKWSKKAADQLEANIINYGVGGYGTDQAYLRYKFNELDSSDVVVINHFVGDLTRNLMQRFFNNYCDFKPQLTLVDDKLIYTPPLDLSSREEFDQYANDPGDVFKDDWLAPGNKYGPTIFTFPYTFSLIEALLSENIKGKLDISSIEGEEAYRRFYKMDYPINLTTKILSEFCYLAKERGQKPLVMFMPARGDFKYFSEYGVWEHQVIIDHLRKKGIQVLDFSPELYSRHQSSNMYEDLYDKTLHFNPVGEQLCADIFTDYMRVNFMP